MKRTLSGAVAKLRAALGTGRGEGDAPRPNAIADALDTTVARGGVHLDATVADVERDPDAGRTEAVTLRLIGDDDLRGGRAEFVSQGIRGSSAAGIAHDMRVHGIQCDWTVYLDTSGFRAEIREQLGGMDWVAVDLGPDPPASVTETSLRASANQNPARFLFYAGAATTQEELEPDEVDGVKTTHLRGTVDIAALGRGAPSTYRPGLELDAQLRRQRTADPRIEAWIDDDGLIRRLLIREGAPQNPAIEILTDVRVSRFGQRVDPPIPRDAAEPDRITGG